MALTAPYGYRTGSCQADLYEVMAVVGSRSRFGGQNERIFMIITSTVHMICHVYNHESTLILAAKTTSGTHNDLTTTITSFKSAWQEPVRYPYGAGSAMESSVRG